MTETYNGYTNYQTWDVVLWVRNDEGYYDMVIDALKDITQEHEDITEQADALQEFIETELIFTSDPVGIAADLLQNAVSHINWYEVLEALLEGLDQD
jgi:hypothetical protein